jgi:WD40 repeat protein
VSFKHNALVAVMAFGPDGNCVLTAGNDRKARLWSIDGKPLSEPLVHDSEIGAVAFSDDGKLMITGCKNGQVRFWDASSGEQVGQILEVGSPIKRLRLSPQGDALLTANREEAFLWDSQTGKQLAGPLRHNTEVITVEFISDGEYFLTGTYEGSMQVWETATGQRFGPNEQSLIPYHEKLNRQHPTFIVPKFHGLLWGKGAVVMRDLQTQLLRGDLLHHKGRIIDAIFSPDGKWLLTAATFDDCARLWKIPPAVPDQPERVRQWIEAMSGQRWNEQGRLEKLTFEEWQKRREQLDRLGGPFFKFNEY